ncbi:cellulase family glycosylhydrolase [Aquibacillus halophilus]|uniref:cellulase n=1 Tax=Aquibacillus halophilus TaxID=930132 RepID=A0A6A8DFV0_9BACI|nr:glycoside hydrolase family 5 protein [Aquibacillus halophilus]MRH41737.1 cellulase family glycosylhydrolase [Aquibacillus halophilus]
MKNEKVYIIILITITIFTSLIIVITKSTSPPEAGLAIEEIDGKKTLVDTDGDKIQLRGISTHGLQWYSAIVNNNAFAAFSNDWDANVVRLAMYIGDGGYAKRPDKMKELVIEGINLAIANDLYVIVDWHVLYPGDPNHETYQGAMGFFEEISTLYPNHPNIIYELANEPSEHGEGIPNDISGWRQVKSYSEPIIKMLRDSGNENLIIVGTPNWSQRPDLAAEEPIDDKNTAYAIHFYAGTHNDGQVMDNAKVALENGVAIFASEWGTSEASGHLGPFYEETDEWLDFLNKEQVSWINWSAANKLETSAVFNHDTSLDPGEDQVWSEEELSESGKFIRSRIRGDK